MHQGKLKNKISFVVISVIAVCGILAVYSVFTYAKNSGIGHVKGEAMLEMEHLSLFVNYEIDRSRDFAEEISRSSVVVEALRNGGGLQDADVVNHLKDFNVGKRSLAVYIMNTDGIAIDSTDESFVGKDYGFREYFRGAMLGDAQMDISVGVTSGQLGYYFSSPVMDGDAIIGVAVVKMDPNIIHEALYDFTDNSGNVALIDEYGVVIFSDDPEWVYGSLGNLSDEQISSIREKRRFDEKDIRSLGYDAVQDNLESVEKAKLFECDCGKDDTEKLVSISRVGEYPLYIMVSKEESELVGHAYHLAWIVSAFVAVAALLALGILYGVLHKSLLPLSRLKYALQNMNTEKLQDVPIERTGNEVEEIGTVINKLIGAIKESRSEVDKRVKEQTKEISASAEELRRQQSVMIDVIKGTEEEKKRSDELAHDLEKFKLAADNVSDAIIITDKAATTLYANPAVKTVTGYEPKEAIGSKCGSLWGGNMEKSFYEDMWGMLNSGEEFRGELINTKKTGEKFIAKIRIAPILGKDGKTLFYVDVMSDITAERRQQQDLEKFKLAIDNVSEHIVITDVEGYILFANAAVEKITGFGMREILGKKAGSKDLWGGLMDKDFYAKMWHVIKEQKKTFSGEVHNKRKSGEEYFAHAIISPVLDDKGDLVFFIGVERDITHEKEVDQAKTEFVSLASHQLRTPLSAINWYAEMLLAGDAGKLTKTQKEHVEEIYHGNKRMVELVNALLNVSRLELGTFSIDPEDIYVCAIAKDVLNELTPMVQEKKIRVVTHLEKGLPHIRADKGLARILFQNLLSNAVKYTPEKGKVSLEITKDEKDMRIIVSDTGMGIPKAQQKRIFEKLFRADNVRQTSVDGTGLGLYTVKSILDATGGSVRFESEEGKGTTFYVTIPLEGMKQKKGTKKLNT